MGINGSNGGSGGATRHHRTTARSQATVGEVAMPTRNPAAAANGGNADFRAEGRLSYASPYEGCRGGDTARAAVTAARAVTLSSPSYSIGGGASYTSGDGSTATLATGTAAGAATAACDNGYALAYAGGNGLVRRLRLPATAARSEVAGRWRCERVHRCR